MLPAPVAILKSTVWDERSRDLSLIAYEMNLNYTV